MKYSAGLLVYRRHNGHIEVLLTHPGGPFWAKKDQWSIPKGEIEAGETAEQTARREFDEETGLELPAGELLDLGEAKASGKTNHIWAIEADLDVAQFKCQSMTKMQWPPRSGQEIEFPENDQAKWFSLAKAQQKIFKGQVVFIERLVDVLNTDQSDNLTLL